MRLAIILVSAITMGCAKSPESIAPFYVSEMNYQSLSCSQLAHEGRNLNVALARMSMQQEQASTGDMVGVLLVGLPVSSMIGENVAPEIGRLKGESIAVERTFLAKQCNLPPPAA